MVWLSLALAAALFTSLTTIFTKIGIKNVKSNFATFYRTGIVILCCVVMCFVTNSFQSFASFTPSNYAFLTLSGICTGCSWLCYYRALKLSNVIKVAPIDKSSFVLTSILFLIFFFNDTTNNGNPLTIAMLFASMTLMLVGTLMMLEKRDLGEERTNKAWLVYAVLSSVFAALVSLFVKIGLAGTSSTAGTLFRTIVVFLFSGTIVLIKKDYKHENKISVKSWVFLTISGICTGAAWLFEYAALNYDGSNPVVVNTIGKLSILLTMLFSCFVLKEKFSVRSLVGLFILTCGILLIVIFGL